MNETTQERETEERSMQLLKWPQKKFQERIADIPRQMKAENLAENWRVSLGRHWRTMSEDGDGVGERAGTVMMTTGPAEEERKKMCVWRRYTTRWS